MPRTHRLLLPAVFALSGCEYAAGIGYLFWQYKSEQAEAQDRLEECGECPEGERCNILMNPAECRPERGAAGDPCGEWNDSDKPEHVFGCEAPLVCNHALEPDSCALPGPVGTPCHLSSHCDAQAWCQKDACVATLPLGAACSDDEACRPNTCLDATLTCTPLRALDEACSSAQDCDMGLACSAAGRCYDHAIHPELAAP